MDDEIPTPVQNRNAAFGEGLTGGQIAAPPSLQEESARFNSMVPRAYRPSGTSNGMSAEQAEATLGGAFGNPNGSALDTWMTKRYFEPAE